MLCLVYLVNKHHGYKSINHVNDHLIKLVINNNMKKLILIRTPAWQVNLVNHILNVLRKGAEKEITIRYHVKKQK